MTPATPTLRRLNDAPRYWGLTITGWAGAATGIGVLYAAVEMSPFGFKPTVTVVLFVLALVGVVFLGVSGQALSPGRQIRAIIRYRRSAPTWALPATADKRGVVLRAIPPPDSESEPAVASDDPEDGWTLPADDVLVDVLEGDE